MSKQTPVTSAVRELRSAKIDYSEHVFDYERHGGAAGAAQALGVEPHDVIKTLVMENEHGQGLIVLMHGDREVSTKALARELGVKSVTPSSQDRATRWTGYQFGGTSPFGLRQKLPVVAERGVAALPRIYINAGKRGFLVGMKTEDAMRLLQPRLADIAI